MNRFERIVVNETARDSQESKVTSTPQNISPVISLSPSISSISNEEVQRQLDSDSENTEDQESQGSSEEVSFSVDNDSLESHGRRLKKAKIIKWTGFWSSLKPKHKNSLYYKLLAQSDETESIVVDLLNIYNRDKKSAVLLILQLFVDLCGYKKLSIDKVYNYEKENSKEVVKQMKYELMETELKLTGKFLFMKCSGFETVVDHIIADFIKQLILKSVETETLLDEIFADHLLEFINSMVFSTLTCIRVVGIVLVLKFLTAFVAVYSQILRRVQDENGNNDDKLCEQKVSIESYIDFLYMLYDKSCLTGDQKCYAVRAKCAQEMYHWIKLFPEIFILKRRCLGRLMKLILDNNEIVRERALATCEKLIRNQAIEKELTQRIQLCLKIVSARVVDTKYKVAVKAVTIFTFALQRYSAHIKKEYKLAIFYRMFEKNIILAKAAGKFLAAYLQHQDNNNEDFLLHFVKIAFFREQFAERVPFFLESCLDFIPELEEWNLIVTILLKTQVNFNTRKHLLAILFETVKYRLTGKLSQSRVILEGVPGKSRDHAAVATAIIPNFVRLMIQLQTDKICLKQLIEILVFIDHNCNPSNLNHHFTDIFSLLHDLFGASLDRYLLEIITNALSCLSDTQISGANVAIETITSHHVKVLTDCLNQLSPNSDRNLLGKIRETSMKVSILFAKFNLTNVLKWEDIYEVYDNNYLKVMKHLIICCKWHLVWSLRQYIKETTDGSGTQHVNHLLYNNVKEFVYGCLDMLKDVNGNSESFLIFVTLCDLYAEFEKDLKRKREFSTFVIKIVELNCQEILMNFVVRYVIENPQLHLNQRQELLNKLVKLIYLGVLPVENFSKILRYYHTHEVEFGIIIESILNQLNFANPALPLLIIHTLADRYNQIVDKYQDVNILSEEARQLKFLAKKFAHIKEMKSSSVVLKLVNMSIYFTFSGEQNYPFLYFAKYFAKLLNEGGKSEAYDLFKKLVPAKDKKNNILLLFAGVLKPAQ